MKKLILLLSILIPSLGWGQVNVSASIGGAISIVNKESLPIIDGASYTGNGDNAKPFIDKYATIKLGYKILSVNFGIKSSLMSAGFKNKYNASVMGMNSNAGKFYGKMVYNSISTSIFADYNINDFYFGLNGGIIIPSQNAYISKSDHLGTDKRMESETQLSYIFGVDVGYNYRLSQNWILFVESNPSFLLIKQEGYLLNFKESGKGKHANYTQHYGTIKAYFIPMSIGIKYSF